jgi:hypothetical protein
MASPSPRRRFQFRLRTLMIGVTLLAVPCGFWARDYRLASERAEFRKTLINSAWSNGDDSVISSFRQWLGDMPYHMVALPLESSREIRDRAKSLFPEAVIVALNPEYDCHNAARMEALGIKSLRRFHDEDHLPPLRHVR